MEKKLIRKRVGYNEDGTPKYIEYYRGGRSKNGEYKPKTIKYVNKDGKIKTYTYTYNKNWLKKNNI